jgi:Tfp pilus assembly protein PilV
MSTIRHIIIWPGVRRINANSLLVAFYHKLQRSLGRRDGMTLVEVMIASGLLLMLLCGLITGFTTARRSALMAAYEMQALHVARQAVETLSACSYADAALAVGANKTLPGLGMSNTYSVAMNPTYPSTMDVSLTVFWQEPAKTNLMSLTYSTSFTACLHNQ